MLQTIFKGLSLATIIEYKTYYEKYKVITGTKENLLKEEKSYCI